MKLRHTMICWDPAWMVEAPGVAVGPHPDTTGWSDRYGMSGGAAWTEWSEWSEERRLLKLFVDFNTLTVRDGIPPRDVHRAFLAIDEYRSAIAPDQEGSAE